MKLSKKDKEKIAKGIIPWSIEGYFKALTRYAVLALGPRVKDYCDHAPMQHPRTLQLLWDNVNGKWMMQEYEAEEESDPKLDVRLWMYTELFKDEPHEVKVSHMYRWMMINRFLENYFIHLEHHKLVHSDGQLSISRDLMELLVISPYTKGRDLPYPLFDYEALIEACRPEPRVNFSVQIVPEVEKTLKIRTKITVKGPAKGSADNKQQENTSG